MKNYFLIYFLILLSCNIKAMNNVEFNNNNACLDHILNNNVINHIYKYLTDGGDIDGVDSCGETLLILAVKNNDLDAVKFLLANNASVSPFTYDLVNSGMKSALDYARENGNHQIIELLQQKYNQELDLLSLEPSEIDFNMFENGGFLDNSNNTFDISSDNFNNSNNLNNDPYNNLFNDMSDLYSDELSDFFNNLQNIESQTNAQDLQLLEPRFNINYSSKYLVNQEENNQNNSANLVENNSNKTFKCDLCNKIFTIKRNLKQHKENVHPLTKDFKCDQCQKAFKSKKYLRIHKIRVHSLIRNWQCDQCKKVFKSKHQLNTHKENVHFLTKSWQCDQCNKAFKRKCKLKEHEKIVHSLTKDWQCDQCQKIFKNKIYLNRHKIRIHSLTKD